MSPSHRPMSNLHPQHESLMTYSEFQGYLDGCIRGWREKREKGPEHIAGMAVYYIDAFQSVRVSYFGELLPPDGTAGQ